MKTMNATDAKNRFGELLDNAQAEPVAIQKNGRDVVVMLSKVQFDALNTKKSGVDPLVEASLQRSLQRWPKLYEELAK